VEAYGRFVIVV